jgi:hypothetical protein
LHVSQRAIFYAKSNFGLVVLGKTLSDFLEEFPFATAEVIAQDFSKSRNIIKNILQ